MVSKPTTRIIEALTQLIESYIELQEHVEDDSFVPTYTDSDDVDADDDAEEVDTEAMLVNEVRGAIEAVMEAEDYSPDDFAALVSSMSEALEEIDPSIFEPDDNEILAEIDTDTEDYDDDIDDLDDDDLDDDLDDEEEDEDEDEEFLDDEEEED
jgi:ribonuclease E